MGLFGHLFESRKDVAKDLVKSDKKRIDLWKKHLSNFEEREELSKHFNYKNVDEALQNFEELDKVLKKIEKLISKELVNIDKEEKTDEEILVDLEEIEKSSDDNRSNLIPRIISMKQKQHEILKLFRRIHKVLKTELHLIRIIKKKPKNVRELLLKLFHLIFHYEPPLYRVFRDRYYSKESKSIHEYIEKIAEQIILQEKIKEETETAGEKRVRKMTKLMSSKYHSGKNKYRKLGERIYGELAQIAKDNVGISKVDKVEDLDKLQKEMKKLVKDDKTMYKIIKKIKRNFDDAMIKDVIAAFHKSYKTGEFDDLVELFY